MNAPWPPDPDELRRHDEQADAERKKRGLDYTKSTTCAKCKVTNGHKAGCTG